MRRGVVVTATALAAMAAGTLPGATAAGDATVTVRGFDLAGLAQTRLNVVGCASVFSRSGQPPRPAIGVVPGGPAGKRSLALTTVAGDAAGPISYASAVAAAPPAAMSVRAELPTTGVGYVGYQAPADAGTNRMWVGRTDLSVPGGAWTDVSLADAAFTWVQYDMGTRQQLAGPVAATPVAAFTASQGGDGYGFYALGFGCEGREFNTDAWHIGSTTYDFEGYAAAVAGGEDVTIAPGGSATLSAQVSSDGPAPRLVLEAKNSDGDWGAAPDQPRPGATSVQVSPDADTTYRWKIYSTPMVEAVKGQDHTEPFTVTVAAPDPTTDPTTESQAPDRQPAEQQAKQQPKQEAKAPAAPAPAAASPTEAAADPEPPAPAASEAPAPAETAPAPAGNTQPTEATPSTDPSETPAG
ncbi:hypothetical protein GON03_16555 [Nocardioides sp. MAH-18]|uniref:Uncharacterized protein n=1 Tax=Nocardioides agri TaxID=2682843 RepID=A0A6L6XUR2_9ACTN|nr:MULTISPECIES: hypothetical protein [unclassified Nocardioides]MBA2955950.1 hypothetical protein [Nocardioides sp. CGMCC 1.13656]MVQ50798.1 hypothetical protein [Nocardioides sp. MAH-18]